MTAHITCPRCGLTSWNPHDVEQGYCGHCHDWTSNPHRLPRTPDPARYTGHATITVNPDGDPQRPPARRAPLPGPADPHERN